MKTDRIARLLPGVYQRTIAEGNPLWMLLGLMEDLHQPAEDVLAHLETYFSPRRAPDRFVPFLAAWVDLAWLLLDDPEDLSSRALREFAPGAGHLRELVATAVGLAQQRGTMQGLIRFLRTATGLDGFSIDERVLTEDGRPIPYHIRLHAPKDAAPYKELILRIAEHEKPAHVTLDPEVVFDA